MWRLNLPLRRRCRRARTPWPSRKPTGSWLAGLSAASAHGRTPVLWSCAIFGVRRPGGCAYCSSDAPLGALLTAPVAGRDLVQTVTTQLPSDYEFGPLAAPLPPDFDTWIEIERAEEARAPGPFVGPDVAEYYYVTYPMGGDGSAWPQLPSLLARQDAPGYLSVVLIPTVMTAHERAAVDHVNTLAQHLAAPQSGYDSSATRGQRQLTQPRAMCTSPGAVIRDSMASLPA